MKTRIRSRLPRQCFYTDCSSRKEESVQKRQSLKSSQIIRKGFFSRKSDSRRIARFHCKICGKNFSRATFSDCFRQKRRNLNDRIRKLFVLGVTQRGVARYFGTTRNTAVRKFLFLSLRAQLHNQKATEQRSMEKPFTHVQFDEMESFETSKCLPVSIPLVVCSHSRWILGAKVASMPAKGPLAEISRKKYGLRKDERREAAHSLLSELKPLLGHLEEIKSDQNPSYPAWIKPFFPGVAHLKFKGRRPRHVGQGELKKGRFDPLFSFNHTAAMIRANVSRLVRKTWATTKKKERLALHLALYAEHHNRMLPTPQPNAPRTI
jgi:hypothetical protein